MPYTGNPYEIITQLESLGEFKVRELLPKGEFGEEGSISRFITESWLVSKESLRRAVSESRSERREEATLAAAKEANEIALKARFEARMANIIAIIAMLLSVIIAIFKIVE